MSPRRISVIAVVLAFGALTAEVLMETGYPGIFTFHMQSFAAMRVLTDFVIVCVLAMFCMLHDAKMRGVNSWTLVVLTLAVGSFRQLFYLVAREVKSGAASRAVFLHRISCEARRRLRRLLDARVGPTAVRLRNGWTGCMAWIQLCFATNAVE